MSQKRAENFMADESSLPKQSRLDEICPYSNLNELYADARSGDINERIAASKYLSFCFYPPSDNIQFQKKVAKMVLLRNLHDKNETLQLEATVTIKNLLKDCSNIVQYLVEENGLLEKLLKLLLSENVELCEQILLLIEEICGNNDFEKRFLKLNGHTAFLEVLSSENSSVRLKAATILNKFVPDIKVAEIYKSEGPVFQVEKVFDATEIPNLSAFFSYMKNPSHILQYSACWCFYDFIYATEEYANLKKIFDEMNNRINVSPLVSLLSSPKFKVRKAATILLDTLVWSYNGNKKQFLQAGALRVLASQLQYPKRRKLAAAGIHNFSKNVREEEPVSTHCTESLEKIIKFLIQILRQKNSEVFESVLIALENFILHPCYRDFCVRLGIFGPLIQAIQNEPSNQFYIHKIPWFLTHLYESNDSALSNEKIYSTIPAMKILLHLNDRDICRTSILAMWKLGKKFESRFQQCLGNFITSIVLSLISPEENGIVRDEKVETLTKPLDQNLGMMLLIENTIDPQINDWEYLPNFGQTVLDQFAIFLSDHYLQITQQSSTRNKIQNEETLLYYINNFDLPLSGIPKPILALNDLPHAVLFNILFTSIVQLHTHSTAIKLAKSFMEKKNLSTFDPKALKNDILKEFKALSL